MELKEWIGQNNDIGIDIWSKKYQYENETLDEFFERICGLRVNHQKVKYQDAIDQENALRLLQLVKEGKFLFAGRTLTNRGVTSNKGSYSNCYSYGFIPDNYNDIMEAAVDLGKTYKAQGGQGISLSKIRPKGTPIGIRFKSDGIVPFMEIYNTVTDSTAQGGHRKGALMISLDARHKEAETFITIKSNPDKITKANLSLEIDNTFMEAVQKYYDNGEIVKLIERRCYGDNNEHVVEYEITPINLYKKLIEMNYDWGEPGALFVDQMRNYNLLEFDNEYNIETTNPCFTGDMKLLTVDGYKTFEDLATNYQKIQIYNYYGELITSNIWKKEKKEAIIEVIFENGLIIKCTPEHRFMLEDETECEAKELKNKYVKAINNKKIKVVDIKQVDGLFDVYDFNEPLSHWGIVEGVIVHNCGEQPLMKHGACNLGSINLTKYVIDPYTDNSKFDFESFKEDIYTYIHAMDLIIDENVDNHALQVQKEASLNWRNIGLGVMGYATALIMLGLKYGSDDAKSFTNQVFYNLFRDSVFASNKLAKLKGTYPKYKELIFKSKIMKTHFSQAEIKELKKDGLRNCSLISIAPTGSISTMLQLSGGCEPEFAFKYWRTTKSVGGTEDHTYEMDTESVLGYRKHHPEGDLPDYFISSGEIDWKDRIDVQSIMQKHVDSGISSTINLNKDITLENMEQLYLYAWKKELKGLTVFRDQCKRIAILTKAPEAEEKLKLDYITPVSRKSLGKSYGATYPKRCACGTLYITVNHNEDGKILECFVHTSKNGICQSNINALTRMISVAMRSGIKIDEIIDQLQGINCPACVKSKANGNIIDGISCPDIISKVIREEYNSVFGEEIHSNKDNKDQSITTKQNSNQNKMYCPDCGAEIQLTEGCMKCTSCGWSKC